MAAPAVLYASGRGEIGSAMPWPLRRDTVGTPLRVSDGKYEHVLFVLFERNDEREPVDRGFPDQRDPIRKLGPCRKRFRTLAEAIQRRRNFDELVPSRSVVRRTRAQRCETRLGRQGAVRRARRCSSSLKTSARTVSQAAVWTRPSPTSRERRSSSTAHAAATSSSGSSRLESNSSATRARSGRGNRSASASNSSVDMPISLTLFLRSRARAAQHVFNRIVALVARVLENAFRRRQERNLTAPRSGRCVGVVRGEGIPALDNDRSPGLHMPRAPSRFLTRGRFG